jgi:nucleoside-diphosphate-sugar epimerase
VCLRYFNVFGPGQYGNSPYATAVSAWCHAIKNGRHLRSDGDGTQSRDLCYIDNVIHANILAATSDQSRLDGFNGRCYNIACGDRTTNNEILNFFKDKYSHAVVVNAPWRPGDVMHTQADIERAQEDFGYSPLIRFWEGLTRTLKWWNI